MKILVTGASGNVGEYVVKYAIMNNLDVVVASRNPISLQQKFNAKSVKFDFTDNSTFDKALDGIDCIFIVRPPNLGNPEEFKPFIKYLKTQQNIKLVVFLSLIGIEKNPFPPHYKIEQYIEKTGLAFCHIRPGFFMQNLSGVHAFEIKHFNKIVVPVSNSLTNFIDTEDIGEFIAKILSEPLLHQNKSYELTGSEAINYYQVAEILSKELGRKIAYTNPTTSFAKNYWIKIRGLDKEYSTIMGMLYMMTRFGSAKKISNDFQKIMNKPQQTFRQFVQKNITYWN